MRKLVGVIGLVAVVALLTLSSGTSTRAGATYDRLVDPASTNCATGTTVYITVSAAISEANPSDTIFVCAGMYTEPTLQINASGVSLLGPGSTPANDGEATIKLKTGAGTNLILNASGLTVSGLTFDATPNGSANTYGIRSQNIGNATITHNAITGVTFTAILISDPLGTGPYTVSNNTVDSTDRGIICTCPNAQITDNDVSSPAGVISGIDAEGTGITISGNTLSNAAISIYGNGSAVLNNSVDGTGANRNLVEATGGDPMTITGNNLSNTTQTAVVFAASSLGTDATFTKNTITNARYGIQIIDFADAFPLTALFGGSLGNANVFIDSGDASGQSGGLLTLTVGTEDYDATFNNWGLCTLAEIEDQVQHHVDNAGLGTVDFDPFIKPAGCPSTSPTPTPSPTPSPTPTPSATPSPTPIGDPTPTPLSSWGDIDCNGLLQLLDALGLMLGSLSLAYEKAPDCPAVGQGIVIAAAQTWGDIDCNGEVDELDALPLLAHLAGVPKTPVSGCPAVGDKIGLTPG